MVLEEKPRVFFFFFFSIIDRPLKATMNIIRSIQIGIIAILCGLSMCFVTSFLADNPKNKNHVRNMSVFISVLASFGAGVSNDLIGRGHTLIIGDLFWIVGLILKSKKLLLVGNSVVFVSIALLLSELAPPNFKGALIVLYQFSIPLGDLAEYILTLIFGEVRIYCGILFVCLQFLMLLSIKSLGPISQVLRNPFALPFM